MATAGVAVCAIMAISPVFAQGTTPSNPSNGSTLLASILAAAQAAGLTAEQTKELLEVAAEFTTAQQANAAEVDEDEDEDDDDDNDGDNADDNDGDNGVAAAPKQEQVKHQVTVTVTVPKSGKEKDDDD
jgi:hypothetical protein